VKIANCDVISDVTIFDLYDIYNYITSCNTKTTSSTLLFVSETLNRPADGDGYTSYHHLRVIEFSDGQLLFGKDLCRPL